MRRYKIVVMAESMNDAELLFELLHGYPNLKAGGAHPIFDEQGAALRERVNDDKIKRTRARSRHRKPPQRTKSGRRHCDVIWTAACLYKEPISGRQIRRALEDDGVTDTASMKGRVSDLVNRGYLKRLPDDLFERTALGLQTLVLPKPLPPIN
jgi:hypothetical protein